jgi:hypothetical protein
MPLVRRLATRRRHWAANLRGETFLSTGIVRLAPAVFLAMSLSWPAFTANVTLGSNLPTVTQNVTFNGGGFTFSGDNQYRGLFVQSGTVAVIDLTIANAVAQGGNSGYGWGGGGGAGLGGALFGTDANVFVNNVSLQNGSAQGGVGGNWGSSGIATSGRGGG